MTHAEQQPDAQGDFDRYPFPRMLYYLLKKEYLGRLALALPSGQQIGSVYFRDGFPVYTDVRSSTDFLGRILLERGHIDEQALNASLQEMASSGELQGGILIRMGALTPQGLMDGLRVQLQRKLNRIFSVVSATFALYGGDHERGVSAEETHVRVDPLLVIYHGVLNAFTPERMKPELDKLTGMTVRLPLDFIKIRPRYGMGHDLDSLLTLMMRGAVPVDRLYAVSDVGPVMAQMLVYILWVTEVLVAEPASKQAGDAPDPNVPGPMTGEHPSVPDAPVRPKKQPSDQIPNVDSLALAYGPPADPAPADPAPADPAPADPAPADPAPADPAPADPAPADPAPADPAPADPAPADPAPADPAPADEMDQAIPIIDLPLDEPPPTAVSSQAAGASLEGPIPIDVPLAREEQPAAVISSVPQKKKGFERAPSLGDEGVYEVSLPAREAPEPAEDAGSRPATPQPDRAVIPAQPARKKRSTGSIKAVDPATVAQHHNLIRKTFSRIKGENHYQVLQVRNDAPVKQIREAYFKLAKDFHPDRVKAMGLDDLAGETEEIFRRISDAHTLLTDAESRKEYDEELAGVSSKSEVQNALTAEFVFQKGLVALRRKQFDEALEDFKEAVKLNPKEGEHVAYVAWTQFSNPKTRTEGNLPQIKMQLKDAISISPKSATCHYFLGEVHLAMGENRQAQSCFNTVVDIKPDHIEASRQLRIMRMRMDKAKDKRKKSGLFDRFRKK